MNKNIVLVLIVLLFGLLLLSPGISATWCDDDYGKKAPIKINNTGGSELTYYQVELNVSYDSDMNANFSDIRVYNESDCSLVPLWNESTSLGNWTNIWFNATNIPAASWCNNTYYLYYKNSSASSVSNGTTTFKLFEDFNTQANFDTWSTTCPETNTGTTHTVVWYSSYNGSAKFHVAGAPARQSLCKVLGFPIETNKTKVKRGAYLSLAWQGRSYLKLDTDIYGQWIDYPKTGYFTQDTLITANYSSTTKVVNHAYTFDSNPTYIWIDYLFIHNYSTPEPTSQLGNEESSITYIPPNPINLQNTTGNYWVNYTWDAGSGNITDSYNVSWNSTWYNNTINPFMNDSVGANNWANITVWAYNNSGVLSGGSVSDQLLASTAPFIWWDGSWTDKREIKIDNTAGSAISHYQVYVNLSSTLINATSLRVVNETADAIVPHWCENVTNGNCYSLWFNATTIPSSSWLNDTYYIYFTNPSVSSTSNGSTTFEIFDNFDINSDSEYEIKENGAQDDFSYDGVNDRVCIDNIRGRDGISSYYLKNTTQNVGWYVSMKGQLDSGSDGYSNILGVWLSKEKGNVSSSSPTRTDFFTSFRVSKAGVDLDKTDIGFYKDGSSTSEILTQNHDIQGNEILVELWATSGTMTGRITRGAVVEHNKTYSHTVSLNDINYVIFGDLRGLANWGAHTTPSTGWMDEFRTRKYISSEPTTSVGEESSVINYNVTGYIKTSAGVPIENVYVTNNISSDTNYTTSNGYYSLSIINGTYKVIALKSKYITNIRECTTFGADLINQNITLQNCYKPPTPINLQVTKDYTWINWTWEAGTGNITDSYNVSIDENWINGTSNIFYNKSNICSIQSYTISVYAFNNSGYNCISDFSNDDTNTSQELSWANSDYDYRAIVCVMNMIYGNYQINFSLYKGTGVNNATHIFMNNHNKTIDYKDIRVYNQTGAALGYWIENTSSDPTTLWINALDNGSVQIYYGYSSASSGSNGTKTFELFDNFSVNSDSEYEIKENSAQDDFSYDGVNDRVCIDSIRGRDGISSYYLKNTTQNVGWYVSMKGQLDSGSDSYGNILGVWLSKEKGNVSSSSPTRTDFFTSFRVSKAGAGVDLDKTDIGFYKDGSSTSEILTQNHDIQGNEILVELWATSGTMTGKITRGAVVEHNKTYSHTVSLNDINYVIFGDLRGLPYYGSYTTPSTGWMGEFRVSKYASIEPTSQLGDEESSITYIPPNPINLQNTTGNFWVNYTWEAGSGNVTNDYNVSVNSSWYNTTNTFYNGSGMSPHGWSNISVWAYNSSGMLSTGNLLDNVQIPNNPITITNTSDWNGFETQNVYVDYDAIDVDSDSFTFSCNRTDLFIDFSITTGKGNWTSVEGIYYVDFGVSDEYCSTDNYTMNIVVLDGEAGVPIGLVNTTGNFWVNHTWNTGSNTNTFNVSVNDSWTNDSSNTYYNNTGLIAHGWSNISIAGYNNTIGDLSSFISQNTQIPNNLPVLSGLPDNTTDENINQTDIFDLDDYFTDVDGDNPTYLVESNNQSAYVDVTINASSNVSYTLADDWYGVVEVVINVTDGWNGEDNDTFMIIINAPSGTIPSVSNVTTGSINPTSQWVDWDVNQTAHNRWKYSLYENMSFESWSAWDNSTDIPNITVSTLTEDTKYYYQAWSYNITNILLTDNSTTANFTTQAAVLTFSELIEAGNANESSFGTDTTHHYYRNGTWQIENWINITVNITGTVDAIFAEWKNETCWTNYTMTPLGDYYTVNITDQPTYDYYTFNIWANTTGTVLTKIYIWSYYDYEESWGTIEEWRKYVGLNATAEPFSYEQFYLYNATYNTDQTSDRCLAHEQGTNGTIDDTGLAYYTSPTTSQERQCANFIGYYIDETIKMDNTSVDNIYLHIWWNNSIEQMYLDYDKETSPNLDNGGYEEIQIYSSNSTMKANLPGFEYSTYNLQNIFWDINDVYFENNEINLFALKGVMSAPSIISFINNTHEYKSFFILNLPDNTTLAALDTDSDELNDYVELFEKWTDPKSNDTDGDSVLDNCDADPLDPSNTTNLCNCGYVSGDWIIDEDVVCEDSTVNVDIGNKIILNATLTMVNSIVIMGEFELVPPNKLIIDPNSKFIIRP